MIHQRVSRRLQRQLENYFHTRRLGEVFDAPLDVILTPHDVFEPDLLGVLHCWIVDPDAKRVECYRLESGGYRLVAEGAGDTMPSHPDWDGLVIDLAALWLQSPFS